MGGYFARVSSNRIMLNSLSQGKRSLGWCLPPKPSSWHTMSDGMERDIHVA